MPGMNLAEMFAQNQGNGFSGSYPYQPTLRPMKANPVAQMPQMGGVPAATAEGIGQVKRSSQDNSAQRLSSAGESSGVSFKHDDEGHATGASAFDTLDGYMKKAGLNSFQTQFFSRMIESGMPESMIAATVKTAGDRFGAEVQAELQDGFEKLANVGVGKAILGGLANLGSRMFGQGARKAVGETVKRTGQKAVESTGKAVKNVIGSPKAPIKVPADAGGFASNVAGKTVGTSKPRGLYRMTKGVGDYIGAPSIQAAGNKGFREGAKQYARGFMPGLKSRAATGGVYGAIDPNNEYMGGNESTLGNIAKGMGYGVIGGTGGQRIMRRSAASQGLGAASDFAGLTDGAQQTMRNIGAFAPNRLSAIPGVNTMAARMGTGEAKMLPAIANKLGLRSAGGATTNQNLAQRIANTPLSTGYTQTGKGNLGLLDAMDPMNQTVRALSPVGRFVNNKAIQPALRFADKRPGLAAAGTTAAIGLPTAGLGVLGINEARGKIDQTTEDLRTLAVDAHQNTMAAVNNLESQGQQVIQNLQDPKFVADVANEVLQQPENQEQISGLLDGVFGQFMANAGTGVLGAVENFLGPEAASFLQEYWPMLLAGGLGVGGGALLGGANGALLGGVALPLATMLAQESGMFGGTGQGDADPSAPQQAQSPVVAPGSAASAEGPSAIRDELASNQMQAPANNHRGGALPYPSPAELAESTPPFMLSD